MQKLSSQQKIWMTCMRIVAIFELQNNYIQTLYPIKSVSNLGFEVNPTLITWKIDLNPNDSTLSHPQNPKQNLSQS